MRYKYIQLTQGDIKMYLFKMNIEELLSESEILRYSSKNKEDYQRPPIPAHYKRIANYLLHSDNPIMPTAILAAIGKEDISDDNGELLFTKKIRIVDGQHRILGMECLNKGYTKASARRYEELKNSYDFPVVLMVIEEKDSMVEVDAFININSKGQRVKTDLAEALKSQKFFKMHKNEEKISVSEEYRNAIAMNIASDINESNSFWRGLIIQPDELGKRNIQPISILAFMRAVCPIVDRLICSRKDLTKEEQLDIEERAESIISEAWECVMDKWPKCFKNEKRMFDQEYNICKGIGVVALFAILAETLNRDDSICDFKEVLHDSKVNDSDWIVGGNFTGFASKQGFVKVKEYIMNKITQEELLHFGE